MRKADSGSHFPARSPIRVRRVAALMLGLALVTGAHAARAADDDNDEDKPFERTLLDNLMGGIGAKRIDDGGIEYRERSPLVVPSKTTLPPPVTGKPAVSANWPKDPDMAARKAAIAADKEPSTRYEESARPLMPSEMSAKAPRRTTRQQAEDSKPGDGSAKLMPSELGYTGGLFSNVFGGSAKPEEKTFKSEPARDTLTQPPSGYQTPSPSFAYGVGPPGSDPGYVEVYDAASGKVERKRKEY